MVQEKGVDTLIRAFAKLLQRQPGRPRLLLIGDGSARPEIERLVAELGIAASCASSARSPATAWSTGSRRA